MSTKRWMTGFTLIVVAIAYCMPVAGQSGAGDDPVKLTRQKMEIVWKGLVNYTKANRQFPHCDFTELIDGNPLMFHLGADERKQCRRDAWGKEFHYEALDDGYVILVSGGENGVIDTYSISEVSADKDDVVLYGTLQDINIMEPKSRPSRRRSVSESREAAQEPSRTQRERSAPWANEDIPEALKTYLDYMDDFIQRMDRASNASQVASTLRKFGDNMVSISGEMKALKEKYPNLKLSSSKFPDSLRPFQNHIQGMMPRLINVSTKIMKYREDPAVQAAQREMQEKLKSLQ